MLGEDATKPAVLEGIKSASLIHIAAHGNAERGEIALAPPASTTGIPQEEDYLLKMSDIAKVKVRAKLVVLSCCHSGRGQIRTEGVVGIARSFLGSGARSVLVALWALDDTTTKKLMSRFLRTPCSWRKCQCISSRGHEVDERSRLYQGSQLGAVYADWRRRDICV